MDLFLRGSIYAKQRAQILHFARSFLPLLRPTLCFLHETETPHLLLLLWMRGWLGYGAFVRVGMGVDRSRVSHFFFAVVMVLGVGIFRKWAGGLGQRTEGTQIGGGHFGESSRYIVPTFNIYLQCGRSKLVYD